MIKQTITFADLDGKPITEDFYFNLTKAELAEMFLSHEGGDLAEYLQEIIRAENGREVIAAFKKIISASVGERSENGRRFLKSEEITSNFMESEAYSELFMELIQNPGRMAEFVKGIVPVDLAGEAEAAKDDYTDEQLLAMSDEAFDRVAGTDAKDMSKQHLQIAFQRRSHRRAS